MTPELLAHLTDDERAAWEACEAEPLSFGESVRASRATCVARAALPAALRALAEARAQIEWLVQEASINGEEYVAWLEGRGPCPQCGASIQPVTNTDE